MTRTAAAVNAVIAVVQLVARGHVGAERDSVARALRGRRDMNDGGNESRFRRTPAPATKNCSRFDWAPPSFPHAEPWPITTPSSQVNDQWGAPRHLLQESRLGETFWCSVRAFTRSAAAHSNDSRMRAERHILRLILQARSMLASQRSFAISLFLAASTMTCHSAPLSRPHCARAS
jgi:hypothetical protein